ncbi:MAG: hypothetical protein L6R39_001053, partial [Caloplaca ligustica]
LHLVTKPFEIHLLLEIRQQLQQVGEDVSTIKRLLESLLVPGDSTLAPLSTELWEIPEEINARFMDFIGLDAPESYHKLPDLPLEEAFDAVVFHFSQSTVQFNPGFDPSQRAPEETQYINLLKSKWILEKLERSCHFTAVGTAPLWASALRDIKSDIIREFKRFDANELVPPPQDAIAQLPDKCFSIWVVKAPSLLPADLAEERPFESQVLELKNVYWAINGSQKPEKSGAAVLQMWQLQSLTVPTTQPSSATPASPAQACFPTTSPRSFSQSSTSTAGSNAWTTRSTTASTSPTLLSGSSATSVISGSSGTGIAVKTPEPPVIVLLTELNDKYTFLHFELTDRIYVNPERCYCRQNSRKPCQIAIIETKSKTIDLRRFQAAQAAEKGLHTWDLARFRIPRHPQFNELDVVKKVEYMTLKFDSVAAKDEFRQELTLLEKVRNLENAISQNILEEKRARDRKPARR